MGCTGWPAAGKHQWQRQPGSKAICLYPPLYTTISYTLYISHTLNDKNTFTINYGRRINRPNYQDLNPFINFLDQYTYNQGNPYLLPQFSHNIELSHNYKGVLNTTLNFSTTNNIINDILVQNDTTKVTYQTKKEHSPTG